MKITIKPDRVFAIAAGDAEVGGMREVSSWEGLRKLVDEQGRAMIVASPQAGSFADIFSGIFRSPPVHTDGVLVSAHPDLAAMFVHPDDAAVDRLADAMKAKLAQKRHEGRSGWNDPDECSTKDLAEQLRRHVAKGDPVDVANFAMMLFNRGGRTDEGL